MSDMSDTPMVHNPDVQAASSADILPGLSNASSDNYRFLASIPVRLSVEVGQVTKTLAEIMELQEGSIVELGRPANELLDIKVNGALVAKGEIITVDGRFAIRVAEVMSENADTTKFERRG